LKRKLIIINIIFHSLAEELLAKESIGLPDIIRILGDRPFPMKETVREYLQEMLDRKEKEDNAAVPTVEATTAEESDKKEEKEENSSETTTKDNEKKE
jgi:hypothetical protein